MPKTWLGAVLLCLSSAAYPQTPLPHTGFSSGITVEPDAGAQANPPARSQNKPDIAAPWWVIGTPDSELRLENIRPYPVALSTEPAIALLFSQAFDADSGYNDQLAVYAADGEKRIAGQWRRAPDPAVLYFTVPHPGHYLLRIRAGLRDAAGHTFNRSLSGPVEVPPSE